MKHPAKLTLLLAFVVGSHAATAGAPASKSSDLTEFISCPIYRDTDQGRKSGCWLADDHETGIRYDISKAPTKPDWNYEVLVEGRVSAHQDNACGGMTLDPVRVSILPGRCTAHILPAEQFPGRAFVLPVRPFVPLKDARLPPNPPYKDKVFHIYFDFGRNFVTYQYADFLLLDAIAWLRAAMPERIIVTGYAAGRSRTVSGRTIREDAAVGRERAATIAEALRRAGLDTSRIETRWSSNPAAIKDSNAGNLAPQSLRRVDIKGEIE